MKIVHLASKYKEGLVSTYIYQWTKARTQDRCAIASIIVQVSHGKVVNKKIQYYLYRLRPVAVERFISVSVAKALRQ
jgi:hypothetical protein